MDYNGYRIFEESNGIIVENVKDFNPIHIFECGQCFRWRRQTDGSFTGVVRDKAANIAFNGGKLVISNSTFQDFKDTWFDYLDLGRDYSEIKSRLAKDEIMRKAVEFGYGIRLLKQDLWEMVISFIISANNMIPRIMRSVDTLSRLFGRELMIGNDVFHTFPRAEELAGSSMEKLNICGAGFRCKYIVQTSKMVMEGAIKLSDLRGMDTGKAREELMKLPGVGPKVADCVLLFSGTKEDVFPTDVWVKRVMEELYFKRTASLKEIQELSSEHFGELTGVAQQYLFYYARENRIGTKTPAK